MKLSDVLSQPAGLSDVMAPDDFGVPHYDNALLEKLRPVAIAGNQALAGYGHGVQSLGEGLGQIGMHVGGAIGSASPEEVRAYDQRIKDEADIYNRDLGQTGAGKVGNFLGQAVTTLPVGEIGLPAKAIAAGAGPMVRLGTNALNALTKTGVQGAAINAAQPVEDVRQPQSLSDVITGNQPKGEDFLPAKLGQAVEGAAIGAGGNLALRGVGAGVEALANLPNAAIRAKAAPATIEAVNEPTPAPAVAGSAMAPQAAVVSPADAVRTHIAEGEQLQNDIPGLTLTPAQQTGDKGLMMKEQKARQSSSTASQVFNEVDAPAAKALDDHIQRTIDTVSQNASTPGETGELVRTALNAQASKLDAARRAQAATDYGAVSQAAGNQPVIDPQNLRAALSDIKTEYGTSSTGSAKAFSSFADEQNKSDLGNVDNLVKLRRDMSRVTGGKDSISGEGVDRVVAHSINRCHRQRSGRIGAETRWHQRRRLAFNSEQKLSRRLAENRLPESLAARQVARQGSHGRHQRLQHHCARENHGAAQDNVARAEMSTTRALMQDVAPDVWQTAKAQVLQDALEQSRNTAVSKGANPLPMQPGEFQRALYGGSGAKAITSGKARIEAMFEPGELAEIQKSLGAVRRLGDMTGYNSSGTASQMEPELGGAAMSALHGNFGTAASKATSAISGLLTNQRVAAAMADPNGRKALLQLSKLPPEAAKARELTAYLATFAPAVSQPSQGEKPAQEP